MTEEIADTSSDNTSTEDALRRHQLLKKQAAYHGVALVSAIALWAAADSWVQISGLAAASGFAVLASIVFGIAVSHIVHEWSHYLGACLTGAVSNIKPAPDFLFFDFDYVANSRRQFLWMSIGGSAGNYGLIVLVMLLIPMDTAGRAMLLATVAAMAVYVAVLELAVIRRVRRGEEPLSVLADHFGQGAALFNRATRCAVIAGVLLWLLLLLFQ